MPGRQEEKDYKTIVHTLQPEKLQAIQYKFHDIHILKLQPFISLWFNAIPKHISI